MRSPTITLSLAFLLACSKGSGEPPGSCYRESDNTCIEYEADKSAAGKRLCTGHRWTTGTNSCPVLQRLGRCTRGPHVETMYGGPPNNFIQESARAVCEAADGRRFTPLD